MPASTKPSPVRLSCRSRAQGTEDLGSLSRDVDNLVGEMESLRQALDETDTPALSHLGSSQSTGAGRGHADVGHRMTAPANAGPTEAGRRLLRSSLVVGIGTGASRVTGLLRTIALAYALGGLIVADSYNLANTTPNVVYDLVLGGILAATLVPIIVERFEHDDKKSIDALATVVTLALAAVTIIATVLAPLIIRLYTIGKEPAAADEQIRVGGAPAAHVHAAGVLLRPVDAMDGDPQRQAVVRRAGVRAGAEQRHRDLDVLGGRPDSSQRRPLTVDRIRDDTPLLLLIGLGTTAGIAAMALVLWPAMRRAGIRLHWNPDWRNPAVAQVARLSAWTLGYVVANQLVFLVMMTLVNSTGDGRVSAFTYAWQFFQLPYGLFTVSIMTTFTPSSPTLRHPRGLDRVSSPLRPRTSAWRARRSCRPQSPTSCSPRPAVTVLLEHGDFATRRPT